MFVLTLYVLNFSRYLGTDRQTEIQKVSFYNIEEDDWLYILVKKIVTIWDLKPDPLNLTQACYHLSYKVLQHSVCHSDSSIWVPLYFMSVRSGPPLGVEYLLW